MLAVQSVTVRRDRVVCIVCVQPPLPRATTPELMAPVLERYPDLALHACVNEKGFTFSAVMNSTSLPHVLEHLIIDLQLAELVRSGKSMEAGCLLTGSTQWVNLRKRTARIEVSYWDDLVVLRCVNQAVQELNELMMPLAAGK